MDDDLWFDARWWQRLMLTILALEAVALFFQCAEALRHARSLSPFLGYLVCASVLGAFGMIAKLFRTMRAKPGEPRNRKVSILLFVLVIQNSMFAGAVSILFGAMRAGCK